MKKLVFITYALAALMLWVWSLSFAGTVQEMQRQVIAGKNVVVVSCTSGVADQSQETNDLAGNLLGNHVTGQGFKVTANSYLYSITVRLAGSGTDSMTMRWGDNLNLATYKGEKTQNVSAGGDVEFVFQDISNQLISGTQYYCELIDTTAADHYQWYYKNSNVYANGTEYNSVAAPWDLTGHQDARDYHFIIKVCQ